ncbi:class I SAM-dependent methyltransferase [Agrobacterium tumefaciens]|uniref:class I SAM-dependent methyltransferase n=1 Tax=Agrobacterium tumefaciens TaxID=358 RepID=UPI00157257B5|nr:class I SAM-dependent methyltransferase [Agrobacterium tumefaciens]NSZ61881.1 class I SAM-dependent methyltransferase [Agrobacterium tumefaciens]NTA68253.1 class I SAM-dependent methyltransferase [Agrobacterium tumefaciens]WIE38093.1 class I SAM-dependent methyltransferase [Agrobacterium tumefaciens]
MDWLQKVLGTSTSKVTWHDKATFSVGGHRITMDYEYGGSKRKSAQSDFTMMKSRSFLDQYLKHEGEDFKRILELGVYQGGSYVFLNEVFKPRKIAAVELSEVPIPALDTYIVAQQGRAKLYYGTSQDNEAKLAEIVQTDFGGELDLVVDDASHFYDQTKASFRTLFPKLRAGGLYMIEDWCWSFYAEYQAPDHPWAEHHSLANLAIDLMEEMSTGTSIDEIIISPHIIKVRRSVHPTKPVFQKTARRGRDYSLL